MMETSNMDAKGSEMLTQIVLAGYVRPVAQDRPGGGRPARHEYPAGALAAMNMEGRARGPDGIRHGTGIHFGQALVGKAGARKRLGFTVIGDRVNAASRIKSACTEKGKNYMRLASPSHGKSAT